MPRDYKNRAKSNKKPNNKTTIDKGKWVLVICLFVLFVWFLSFLRGLPDSTISTNALLDSKNKTSKTVAKQDAKTPEPHFDFYTILPTSEIPIPDYEFNRISREEKIGKGKNSQYSMQIAAFRQFSTADKLKARLALLGIETRIEQIKVGSVVWNRVKIGPVNSLSYLSKLKKQLKAQGISNPIVTQIKTP